MDPIVAGKKKSGPIIWIGTIVLTGAMGLSAVAVIRAERLRVREVAAVFLRCDPGSVTIARDTSRSENLDEFPVSGCGERGMVACSTKAQPMLNTFLHPAFNCAFHELLPDGRFDPNGRIPER